MEDLIQSILGLTLLAVGCAAHTAEARERSERVRRSVSSWMLGPRTRDLLPTNTERVSKISVRLDLNDIVARVLQIELGLLLRRTAEQDRGLGQKRDSQGPNARYLMLPLHPRKDDAKVALALALQGNDLFRSPLQRNLVAPQEDV